MRGLLSSAKSLLTQWCTKVEGLWLTLFAECVIIQYCKEKQ